MPDNTLVELAMQFRQAALKRDAATLKRLAQAYQTLYNRIKTDMDALALRVLESGEALTPGQVMRLQQWKQLVGDIQSELQQYSGFMQVEIRREAEALIAQATKDTRLMIAQALGGGADVQAAVRMLNPAVIESLLGILSPDGKIFKYWEQTYKDRAADIARVILEGIGAGKNPRAWAGILKTAMGETLTSALRTARTVQLYAYREATRANYAANRDVVKGWQWVAALDDRTCPACIALNGTFYEIEQAADAHWNCRCVMVPVTILSNPDDIQKGEDWFKEQSEESQRKILGDGKFEAWKEGKFEFSQLAQHGDDKILGAMWHEATLKELIGDS